MPVTYKGHELLISKLYDAQRRVSEGHQQVVTFFLTPAEQEIAKTICRQAKPVFIGGYPDAERRCALFDPAISSEANGWAEDDPEQDAFIPVIQNRLAEIVCLKAESEKGKPELRHPDVLGALLHLGISREALGDIVCSGRKIYLFCKRSAADLILHELCRIGSSNIRFEEISCAEVPAPEREILNINVSSLRYDAVVSALARTSRSKAGDLIRSGLVKINDVVLDHKGELCNNDVVSIRRSGRFRFLGIKKTTRKDRLVLEFLKYS